MEKRTIQQIGLEMDNLNDQSKVRELTPEEKNQYNALVREYQRAILDGQAEQLAQANREKKVNFGQILRENLKGAQTQTRDITFGTTSAPGAIINGEAYNVKVEDIIPNLEEGNGLPSSCPVTTAVDGNIVFPTSADDVEITEAGETAVIADQSLDLDNVKVAPGRVTLSVDISNKAIDNASFDVLSFVQGKFQKAWRKFLATKVFSQASFSGIKGGFSGLASAGTITLGAGTACKAILQAIADFTNLGFDASSLCLVIDATTEAGLKVEPKAKGEGKGFVIEDGKLLGYEYVVTSKINTVLGGDSKTGSANTDTTKLYKTTKKYFGIGYFDYLKVQQHGEMRFTMDGTSKDMAKHNAVNMTLNTEVSVTNLSSALHDEDGNVVSAFAVYEIA